ncbi:MAG: radical SAM protein [Candidatus Woesearchaeota archaeon]
MERKNNQKKEKILLIRPPIIEVYSKHFCCRTYSKFDRFYSYAAQPAGLLRVASYLKKQGHEVILIDCLAEVEKCHPNSVLNRRFFDVRRSPAGLTLRRYYHGMSYQDIERRINDEKPDRIMIGTSMTYYYETVHEIVKIAKRVCPHTPVVLGGLYATLCSEHAKKSGADIVYSGELPEANNIWTDLTLLSYKPKYAIIKSTRGCPNNCTYCVVPKLEGHTMRFRCPSDVVEEIKDKIKKHKIRKFIFWESNLLMKSREHFEKILDIIISEKIKVELHTPEGLQPNLLNEPLARKMRLAGFKYVSLPLETSDDRYNKTLNRRTKTKDFDNAVSVLLRSGFSPKDITVFVLAGLPEQDIENVVDSVLKAFEHGCRLSIMPFTPIPGSEEFSKHRDVFETIRLEDMHPLMFSAVKDKEKARDLLAICELHHSSYSFLHVLSCLKHRPHVLRLFIKKIKENKILLEKTCRELGHKRSARALLEIDWIDWFPKKDEVSTGHSQTNLYYENNQKNRGLKRLLFDWGTLLFLSTKMHRRFFRQVYKMLDRNDVFVFRVFTKYAIYCEKYFDDNPLCVLIETNNIKKIKDAVQGLFKIKKRYYKDFVPVKIGNQTKLAPSMIVFVVGKSY